MRAYGTLSAGRSAQGFEELGGGTLDEALWDSRPLWTMRRGAALAIAIVVTVAVVTVASFSGDSSNGLLTDVHEKPKPMALFEASETSSVGSLSFTTHNAYTERAPITWWRQVQGAPAVWKHLAEPYKESTFTAVLEDSAAAADGRAGSIYSWDVDGTRYQGASIAHTFNKVGHYGVQLTCLDATTGKVIDSIQDTVTVKYVRREIRALSEADRERFFNAMETLYRLPTFEGVALYGPEYKGIDFFVQIHLDGAGVLDCDHWHDDAGIMTHHVGYTLQFEQALQLLDPSVSIPYWEYTLDAYELGLTPEELRESVVFSESWFGDINPRNEFGVVSTGRWAYTPVRKEAWQFVHNPYGLLRTPWNTNPAPYLTRHGAINNQTLFQTVNCVLYEGCFQSTTLGDMNVCLNGQTHGPLHIIVGGEWNHKDTDFLRTEGVFGQVVQVSKGLWRRGYLRIPEGCNGREPNDCLPYCPDELITGRGKTAYDVLIESQALKWLTPYTHGRIMYDHGRQRYVPKGYEDANDEFLDAYWTRMLKAMCNPGYVGDMYTSAAPQDPVFWVLHPAAERLFNSRRLVGAMPDTPLPFDETWGYTHATQPGDMGVVCDWTGVGDFPDMPTCVQQACHGHGEDDVLPFDLTLPAAAALALSGGRVGGGVSEARFFGSGDGDGDGNGKVTVRLTNGELLALLNPTNDALPYMYDNYDWKWCDAQNITVGLNAGFLVEDEEE